MFKIKYYIMWSGYDDDDSGDDEEDDASDNKSSIDEKILWHVSSQKNDDNYR